MDYHPPPPRPLPPRRRLQLLPRWYNNSIFLSHLTGGLFVGTAPTTNDRFLILLTMMTSWLPLLLIHPSIEEVRRRLLLI